MLKECKKANKIWEVDRMPKKLRISLEFSVLYLIYKIKTVAIKTDLTV